MFSSRRYLPPSRWSWPLGESWSRLDLGRFGHARGVLSGSVRYARNGAAHLAFRVFGEPEAPPLVFVPGWVSNVGSYEDPTDLFATMAERLSASTRYVVWDKRGTGLSDPVHRSPPLDERMDDLQAVMDAAGVKRATLLGMGEGGPTLRHFLGDSTNRRFPINCWRSTRNGAKARYRSYFLARYRRSGGYVSSLGERSVPAPAP